jgi:hypothetical protein
MGISFTQRKSRHTLLSGLGEPRWRHLRRPTALSTRGEWVVVDPRAQRDPDRVRAEQLVVVRIVDDVHYDGNDRVAEGPGVFAPHPEANAPRAPWRLATDGTRYWLVNGMQFAERPSKVSALNDRLFDADRLLKARSASDNIKKYRDEAPVWLGSLEASTRRSLEQVCGNATAEFEHVVDLDASGFSAESTVTLPMRSLQRLLYITMRSPDIGGVALADISELIAVKAGDDD